MMNEVQPEREGARPVVPERGGAQSVQPDTPWRRVYLAFGARNQTDFAKLFGRDKSKISRVLADKKGLINGPDQERVIGLAAECGVTIEPAALLPGYEARS